MPKLIRLRLAISLSIFSLFISYLKTTNWQLINPALANDRQNNIPLDQNKKTEIKNIQDLNDSENRQIFNKIINYVKNYNSSQLSMGEIVQLVAEQFLGAEYKAGLLERSPEEKLVISLKQFDCLLFVETVLAIARNIALQDYSYQTFTNHIQEQRYFQGKINGYCSRLHYFSDWIRDNQSRNIVDNITTNLGGIFLPKKLDFMTTHRKSYPQLITNEANYQCLLTKEANLKNLPFYYIPNQQIRDIYNQLQPGDIVGVATNIPGLDVTHTGLVYRHSNGSIGLIHASPIGKVVIAPDLQSYISNVDRAIGIVVARPNRQHSRKNN
jgi:hypothetical protein